MYDKRNLLQHVQEKQMLKLSFKFKISHHITHPLSFALFCFESKLFLRKNENRCQAAETDCGLRDTTVKHLFCKQPAGKKQTECKEGLSTFSVFSFFSTFLDHCINFIPKDGPTFVDNPEIDQCARDSF